MWGNVFLELGEEQGCALRSAALVTHRVLNLDFVKDGAIVELDQEGVTDRALLGVVVLDAELVVFDAVDLGAESVDAGVSG